MRYTYDWTVKTIDPCLIRWTKYAGEADARPMPVFRSISKFDQNLEGLGLKYDQPITTKLCIRHDRHWRLQNVFCDRLIILWTRALVKFHWISNSMEISLAGRVPREWIIPTFHVLLANLLYNQSTCIVHRCMAWKLKIRGFLFFITSKQFQYIYYYVPKW